MSLMTWSLEAAYISVCVTFSLRVWHCSLSSSMIAIGSLLPRASVDLLLALTSLDSLPGLSSTALGVLCPVGVLLGDRWLRRAFPLRATSRADLGVLVVDALRCLEVIFCHPDFVVLVDFSPLSAVPGEDCEIPSAGAAALPSKVNCVSPLSPCIFAMLVLIGFHDRLHPTLVNSTQVLSASDGGWEPLRLITCEQNNPCSGCYPIRFKSTLRLCLPAFQWLQRKHSWFSLKWALEPTVRWRIVPLNITGVMYSVSL